MGNSPKEPWSGVGVRPSLLFVLNIDHEVSYYVAVLALPELSSSKGQESLLSPTVLSDWHQRH